MPMPPHDDDAAVGHTERLCQQKQLIELTRFFRATFFTTLPAIPRGQLLPATTIFRHYDWVSRREPAHNSIFTRRAYAARPAPFAIHTLHIAMLPMTSLLLATTR